MDFTQKIYRELLETLKTAGYTFQTFEDFVQKPNEKVVVLRHDVDILPQNALDQAAIEHGLGIKARNYYRIVKKSNVLKLIMAVRDLGHEIVTITMAWHLPKVINKKLSICGRKKGNLT